MTEPCGNVAYPQQTKAEADDQALQKWAALRIYQVKKAQTSRRRIEAELVEMTEQQRERARHWLNHYRNKAEQE